MSSINEDTRALLSDIKKGEIGTGKFILTQASVMLQKNEESIVALPDIQLWEPRSVRQSAGHYGGPSIRIASGFTWRMGTFAARSESHEELRIVDKGIFTITNMRILFSGSMRNVQIGMKDIFAVDPYHNGTAVKSTRRGKTHIFLGYNQGRSSHNGMSQIKRPTTM